MTLRAFTPIFLFGVAAVAAPRIEKTIDRDWTFQDSPAPDPDLRIAQPGYDDSHWPAVALPHTRSTYETTGDLHPFIRSAAERDDSYWWYGWNWYRKQLVIGKQYAGRLVALEFDGVAVERNTIAVEGRKGAERVTYAVTMAGKPAHLALNSSAKTIAADRAGIAVLSAEIVDAAGVHVYGASPDLTWTVTGPAKLAGPPVYRSDTAKKEAMEGTMYIDAPVANLVRSTATPGTIKANNFSARAFSSGEPQPAPAPAAEPGREQKRKQIRAALFVPDPLPALQPESYGQIEIAPGVIAERVSYATDYGLRVPAMVYRPARKPAGKMPGLIVVNGHGGDKYSWYAFYSGILYAQAGATVLTYDPVGEGERNAQRKNGTRQHDRNLEPEEMGKRMGGLMMTDVMQAVSYLAQRPDVDGKRLAAMGYSMGSFVLGMACAAETRLNACVLVGGGNLDGDGGYWDSSSKKMCQAIPYQSMKFLGDRGAVLYDLHADRGATLVWNGSDDDVVSIPKMGPGFFEGLQKRTIALHGSPKNVFEFGFTEGGGHRPYFVTRPVALWLEKRLDFPNWTAGSIARMPETHILEWAEKGGVFIDGLYATELREGGTRALGAGVPAVAHDLLNALPEDRWQRDQDKYVYETWVKAAKARVK